MAYADVASLLKTLDDVLHPNPVEHQIPHSKEQIESLQETLMFFRDEFLEVSWCRQTPTVGAVEGRIRDVARKAQDIIESYMSQDIERRNKSFVSRMFSPSTFMGLDQLTNQLNSIKIMVSKLLESWRLAEERSVGTLLSSHSPPRHHVAANGNNTRRIGFEPEFQQLRAQLIGQIMQPKLQTIALIGAGGSGKTALAESLYLDSGVVSHFEPFSAWVTLSKNYCTLDFVSGVLNSMAMLTDEICHQSFEILRDHLKRSLMGRRYLIVMDDVWHKEVWDDMTRMFPDDNNGSRIIFTTRIPEVAAHGASYCYHMRPLNEQEAWDLLCQQLFVQEISCPPELEQVGKRIAKSCMGLPLALVLTGGRLSKVPRERSQWTYFADNLSTLKTHQEVLSLSYTNLPPHLKPCFLYMGAFPQDHEIPASKLIKLWDAEGFLKPIDSKTLEEVAKEFLKDLETRKLILVGETRFDGQIKTYTLHDRVRELCLDKAKEEKCLQYLNSNACTSSNEASTHPRRLSVCSYGDATDIFKATETLPLLRSLIYTGFSCVVKLQDCSCCKLLRVLDLYRVDVGTHIDEILKLVHLRYLAFTCNEDIQIPESLPKYLWHLQTFIIYQRSNNAGIIGARVYLPKSIWRMTKLRHLQFGKATCPLPLQNLEELHTLLGVSSSCCTMELFNRTPNLKKLRIRVEQSKDGAAFCLSRLVHLPRQLEILKCLVEHGSSISVSTHVTFPRMLKEVTLSNTKLSWVYMPSLSELHHLEVLKLRNYAFQGERWEIRERDSEFCQLKYLLIEGTDLKYWEVESNNHFPVLQHLTLFECPELQEIPSAIGDVDTLERIVLDDASPSAVASAKKIQQEQVDTRGEGEAEVCVLPIWEFLIKQKEKQRKFKKEGDKRWKEYKETQKERENSYHGGSGPHPGFDRHWQNTSFGHNHASSSTPRHDHFHRHGFDSAHRPTDPLPHQRFDPMSRSDPIHRDGFRHVPYASPSPSHDGIRSMFGAGSNLGGMGSNIGGMGSGFGRR